MRKLVLFGVLAGIFGLALLLESVFSRSSEPVAMAATPDKAIWVLGGGPPRSAPAKTIPEAAPAEQAPAEGPRRRDEARREKPRPKGARDSEDRPQPPASILANYTVKKGETLSSIARAQLGTTTKWQELAHWNGIADPASLREGMTLRLAPPATAPATVPAGRDSAPALKSATLRPAPEPTESPRTHKVAKGETLSKLAVRYLGDATRWREIQKLNRIADPAALTEGATLSLPER